MDDEDQDAIRALFAALGDAIDAGDFDAAAASFADDAVLMLPGQPAIMGRPAIRAALMQGFGAGAPKTVVTVSKLEVAVSRDVAYARGTGITHLAPPVHSKWLAVLRRNGRWRIVADIFNDDGAADVR